MKTFKNRNFVKRDYECTNVVACRAEVAPGPDWIEYPESILTGVNADGRRFSAPLMKLETRIQNGVTVEMWGWL